MNTHLLNDKLNNRLQQHQNAHLHRQRRVIERRQSTHINLEDQALINFCSSDYLNLTQHPAVIAALKRGADQYGFGSGASAMISGYHSPHHAFETACAQFLNREKALLFNSGYAANLGVITALADSKTKIFVDSLCHASIMDAIKLSRAKFSRYRHNDVDDLQQKINKTQMQDKIIVSESVFSMVGDIANLPALFDCAQASQATLIIDDAHGMGVLGDRGAGIIDYHHFDNQDIPVLITPLGKGLGGMGAIVSGSAALIDTLTQFSRTYIYTTAMPPVMACGLLAALNVIQTESWRREQLHAVIALFIKLAQVRNLELCSEAETPIKSIIIGDNAKTIQLQQQLRTCGFYVGAIRPPTVPEGTARLRLSLNCLHTHAQIVSLLDYIVKFMR